MRFTVIAAFCLLSACSPKSAETQSAAPPVETAKMAPSATDAWLGKWIGVEGNTLQIDAGAAPGEYAVTEGTLDGALHYTGKAQGEVIATTNGGKSETIRSGAGPDTGLKYLADKHNCLVIESGRGFCR